MSGIRAPLETALLWCGWRARTYELLGTPIDEPADLLDPEVQIQAKEYYDIADVVIFQMDCSTLTRAREVPLRGDARHIKSLPLRGEGPPSRSASPARS